MEQGDFYALLGPNGAGKSTTIGIVTSLVNKTAGTVKVFGYDPGSYTQLDVYKRQVFDWGTNVIGHHTLAVEYIKQIFL